MVRLKRKMVSFHRTGLSSGALFLTNQLNIVNGFEGGGAGEVLPETKRIRERPDSDMALVIVGNIRKRVQGELRM